MRPKLLTRNQKTPPAARSGKERCICSETSYRRLLGGGLLLPVLLLEGFLLLNEIPDIALLFSWAQRALCTPSPLPSSVPAFLTSTRLPAASPGAQTSTAQ